MRTTIEVQARRLYTAYTNHDMGYAEYSFRFALLHGEHCTLGAFKINGGTEAQYTSLCARLAF